MKVRKAIIPAAGLGTRFLPATKAQPKEMLTIVDKPTIQYIVEEAIDSGIEDILIVTGRNKRSIEDHFDKSVELEDTLRKKGKSELLEIVDNISNLADIYYIRQKEPLGLGHAIYCARKFVGNEPFAILLGDDVIDAPDKPCLKQMIELYEDTRSNIVGVMPVDKEETKRYGIVKKDKQINEFCWKAADLIEKPSPQYAPSNLAIMGRYVLNPEVFDVLARTENGAGGEIQLTDALRVLCRQQELLAYQFQGKHHDIGDKLGFLKATVEFGLKKEELQTDFKKYLLEMARKIQDDE